MTKIFPHATKQNPCPICLKPDWCCFGDRAMKCMRVESAHACPSGGWWHFYTDKNPDFIPRKKSWLPRRPINAAQIISNLQSATRRLNRLSLIRFAEKLKVSLQSLMDLQCSWYHQHNAWAFPMRDGNGSIVGIRLRNEAGFKWAESGSSIGLFEPFTEPSDTHEQLVLLCEGPTDTAAALSLGFYAIGRPNCNSGNDIMKQTLRRLGIRRVVIVSDNDEMKRLGNRDGRPGIEGAMTLKRFLGLPSVIWLPPSPIKDIREFVQRGGTAEMIQSSIGNKVWTKV